MYTIRYLCRISKLSRSAILYYDSLGLLKPVERSASNYRLYSDDSLEMLKRICLFREAGISLKEIGTLITVQENDDIGTSILENTLFQLNCYIRQIQEKRNTIVSMIKARKSEVPNDIFAETMIDDLINKLPSFAFDINKALGFDLEEIG